MSTFVLKRKTFSDDSTGKKIAAGTLGALGTGAALFAGAKSGKLGNTAMFKANKAWGNLGARLSKSGIKSGEKMMISGAQGIGKARGNILADQLKNKGVDAAQIQVRQTRVENAVGSNQLNKLINKASK
jgi:hypothetical protein